MTFKQKIDEALAHVDTAVQATVKGSAVAEYTLCKRHLEDAIMRFNRGVATEGGFLKTADLESPS